MGCDIHIIVEHRDTGRDVWVGVPTPSNTDAEGRNYELFATIANVRGPGAEPRGIPEDASSLARYWGEDDLDMHSHSWLSLTEANQAFAPYYCRDLMLEEERMQKVSYKLWGLWLPQLDGITDEEDNFRIVFWFDN